VVLLPMEPFPPETAPPLLHPSAKLLVPRVLSYSAEHGPLVPKVSFTSQLVPPLQPSTSHHQLKVLCHGSVPSRTEPAQEVSPFHKTTLKQQAAPARLNSYSTTPTPLSQITNALLTNLLTDSGSKTMCSENN